MIVGRDGTRRTAVRCLRCVADEITQRSMLYPDLEWTVPQVKFTVDPNHGSFNAKARQAKDILRIVPCHSA